MSKMILSITLLLLFCLCSDSAANSRHPFKNQQCCRKVSSNNMSRSIKGTTYQIQFRNGRCVHAIIFRSYDGRRFCVDPKAAWLKNKIPNMRRL